MLLGVGGALALAGSALCIGALYLHLASFLSPAGAALTSGLATLALAGAVCWLAIKIAK